jgi:hypothetical protein
MKLVVTMLVRDQLDIVAAAIEYYLAQGVHAIIVTDNRSADGTLAVLEDYEAAGAIVLIQEPGNDYRQSEWVTRMARLAATDYDADWVINTDADEFWRASDSALGLVEVLAARPTTVGVVSATRHDLRGRGGHERGWFRRLRWLDRQTVSERGTPLTPKVAHAASASVVVTMGNHDVTGVTGERDDSGQLEIVHVPLRSWRQFEGKIRLGGLAVQENKDFSDEVAWHWRADYKRLESGELEAEYWARSLKGLELIRGMSTARFRRERLLHRTLKNLRTDALLPHRLNQSLRA